MTRRARVRTVVVATATRWAVAARRRTRCGSRSRVAVDRQCIQAGEAVLPQREAHAERLQHRERDTADHALHRGSSSCCRTQNLIDIIGVQGHAFSQSEPAPMPTYRANLDRLATRRSADPCDRARCRRHRRCGAARRHAEDIPDLLGASGGHGHHALGLQAVQPLAQCAGRLARLVAGGFGRRASVRPCSGFIAMWPTSRRPSRCQYFWIPATRRRADGRYRRATDPDAGTTFSRWQRRDHRRIRRRQRQRHVRASIRRRACCPWLMRLR